MELTSEELDVRFGPLIERAVSAFETDPSYVVDMAEHASLVLYKRLLWQARTIAQRKRREGSKVPLDELTRSELMQLGASSPPRLSRGRRKR